MEGKEKLTIALITICCILGVAGFAIALANTSAEAVEGSNTKMAWDLVSDVRFCDTHCQERSLTCLMAYSDSRGEWVDCGGASIPDRGYCLCTNANVVNQN